MKYSDEQQHEFARCIPSLLKYADKILATPELANAPVPLSNGVGGHLPDPSLGGYIDWWINDPEYSRDKHGNYIWSVVGNPMTGSNHCRAVDDNGNDFKAELKHGIIDTARSYCTAMKKYPVNLSLPLITSPLDTEVIRYGEGASS